MESWVLEAQWIMSLAAPSSEGPFCSGRKGNRPSLEGCAPHEVFYIPSIPRLNFTSGSPTYLCIRLMQRNLMCTLGPIQLKAGVQC